MGHAQFNGVFSRNNLPEKIKDGVYVINLDDHADVGTHWIALFCNGNELFWVISKVDEIDKIDLTDQKKFRLN